MKCPKCGEEMYSVKSGGLDSDCGNYAYKKYICLKCGYEIIYRDITNDSWICPKCRAVLSSSIKECPYCTPYKSTCGTISGITTVPTNDYIASTNRNKGK